MLDARAHPATNDDSLQWPQDDAYQPHIDRYWLVLLSSWIAASNKSSTTSLHRSFHLSLG
jgi:hypothetical protein